MNWIKSPKDFWAGVLYIAFGAAAIGFAYSYPVGSAGRMGPGYFPRALGLILLFLGVLLALRAVRMQGAPMTFGSFKPLSIVIGSVILFGLAAPKLGLMVATVILIVVSSTASDEFRWKEAAIASIVMAIFTYLAFSWGLNLQLPVWPWFVGQ